MSSARYLAAAVPPRLANSGATVVLPLLAVERTGDVALGGFLIAFALAPSVLAAPLVGAVLDRSRHPRRLLVASGLVTAAGFSVAGLLGEVPLWVVVLALLVSGAATPFAMGGLSSFVTDSFADPHRAYASDALAYNVGAVAGPAVGGLVVAWSGAGWGAVVLAGACLVGALAATTLVAHPHERGERRGLLREMGAGLRFLTTSRPIAAITASATVNQLGIGGLAIAALVLTLQRGGEAEQSAWILTAFAIGGLTGAAGIAARPIRRWSAPVVMPVAFAATGVCIMAAGIDLGLWWTIALVAIGGLFTAAGAAALLQARTAYSPAAVRSQVFTVGSGLRASGAAIGAALAGALSGWDGALLFLLVGGVGGLGAAAIMLAFPRDAEAVGAASMARDSAP